MLGQERLYLRDAHRFRGLVEVLHDGYLPQRRMIFCKEGKDKDG